MTIIMTKDPLRAAVEANSGGRATVLYDKPVGKDKGCPSYMHVVPRFNIEDVLPNAGAGTYPAFIVGGVEKSEIFVPQYQALVLDGRAHSLPGVDPTAVVNFDTAKNYCEAKGPGWHLMTNAEWAALALWSLKNGTLPNGNNNYGRDHAAKHETAIRQDGLAPGLASGTARTKTGSGPASWRHDGTVEGVSDLNGNVWEWVGGMRLNDGEVQIIPDNDAAITGADQSAGSSAWQAIAAADGALVAPGTVGSLKYDATTPSGGAALINDEVVNSNAPDGSTGNTFEALAAADGITVPDIMRQLLLAPGGSGLGGDYMYARNYGERLPLRGGYWCHSSSAGVFALYLIYTRSTAYSSIGFRPAFVF